ncbi:MAG: Ig-like domain-containing protein, partial [Anaerolineae bacterium]|nr:Ig-like domain-containing protein [Anaerolineae bacterium]
MMKVRAVALSLVMGLSLALGWASSGRTASVDVSNSPDTWSQRPALQAGSVITVCPAAVGLCPYTSVQAAVNAASAGAMIKVATGVYSNLTVVGSMTQVVYLAKSVVLRGGYTPEFVEPPDPVAHPTVLDAQGLGRVLTISGTVTPTIEGFYITNGNAAGLDRTRPWYGAGGGVYVKEAAATISNCTVYSNVAGTGTWGFGGGLYVQNASVVLLGNVVRDNVANTVGIGDGGGIHVSNGTAAFTDNVILSNTASTGGVGTGGGLSLIVGTATFDRNLVQGNTASTLAEGRGGGLYLGSTSAAVLSQNSVLNNVASMAGTGYGGGVFCSGNVATFAGTTVRGNVASVAQTGRGGGLYLLFSLAALNDTLLEGNLASGGGDGFGGGLALEDSVVAFESNRVLSNTASLSTTATAQGGGLWLGSNSFFTLTNTLVGENHAAMQGSGLWLGGGEQGASYGTLMHTTVVHNGGVGDGVFVGPLATAWLTNTIIANHAGVGITTTAESTAALEATLWYGNGLDWGGDGEFSLGTVVLSGDPAFADPAAWDYHLNPKSAAVDVGVDLGIPVDLDGTSRPLGPLPDLGAYEGGYAFEVTKEVTPTVAQPGDRVTYTVGVASEGFTLTHGSLSDFLPAGLHFVGPAVLEPPDAGTLGSSATLPFLATDLTLAHGERITLTFPVTLGTGLAGGVLTNTALITGAEVQMFRTGSASLTVLNVPPAAGDDLANLLEDEPTVLDVLSNDSDLNGDLLTVAAVEDPLHGVVEMQGTVVTYVPALNFNGTDAFAYVVSDGILTD